MEKARLRAAALALLAGGRSSAQSVRDGSDEAVVEAVFDTTRLPELEQQLAERGVETDEHDRVAFGAERAGAA